LFAEHKFAEALDQYRDAVRQEQRRWVRRRLMAQAVWCYRNLGEMESAAGVFLSLAKEDPHLLDFDAIPLAWTAAQPSPTWEDRLRTWLTGDNAPAALIAASWLLTTPERPAATEKLRALTNHTDRRIALLAEAQRWRAEQATARPDDVRRWQDMLERMPEPLRPGPYVLIGQALARLGEGKPAVLALLRVPVLYPQHRELAAEALLSAGRELEKLDRGDEARELYRELAADFAESRLAAAARQRIEQLAQPTGSSP
jgi:tetratricopeptide (TPR) repeat protein